MNEFELTPLAKSILPFDPHFSHPATAWILHHHLVSRPESPTTWNWFFCRSGLVSFTRDQFLDGLRTHIAGQTSQKYAERSLESDFQVLVRMYQDGHGEGGADHLFYPSAFGTLGLIQKNKYQDRYRRVMNPDVPIPVFFSCLHEYALNVFPDAAVLDLELLREGEGSPFRSFGVSLTAFFELARKMPAAFRKHAKISHTAGMHTITFGKNTKHGWLKLVYQDDVRGSWL